MEKWLKSLKDLNAAAKIKIRIRRIQEGNFGDVKPVGEGVSEMRIHCGKGYRVYFTHRNNEVVILLCGGDKDTQPNDIKIAKKLADKWEASCLQN
jgi:putative addiction module killer protein